MTSQRALLRAEGYRLLAFAFRYPEETELRELLAEESAEGEESSAVPMGEATTPGRIAAILLPLVDGELAAEYNRLFAQSVAVSPHERAYTGGDLGPGLGQLAALYEAFGLRSGGSEGEVPDHVGAELEFAAFLSLKEALHSEESTADAAEAVAIVRAVRKTFMQEHLGRWVMAFSDRLQDLSHHPYYVQLARLLKEWVQADFVEQDWELPRGGRHLPVIGPDLSPEVGDDSEHMTCPSAPREEESLPLSDLLHS